MIQTVVIDAEGVDVHFDSELGSETVSFVRADGVEEETTFDPQSVDDVQAGYYALVDDHNDAVDNLIRKAVELAYEDGVADGKREAESAYSLAESAYSLAEWEKELLAPEKEVLSIEAGLIEAKRILIEELELASCGCEDYCEAYRDGVADSLSAIEARLAASHLPF